MAENIFKAFQKILFTPILDLARKHNAQIDKAVSEMRTELRNAEYSPLTMALRTGLVQYKDGVFSGAFSRAISANLRRLGARFDTRTNTYRLADSQAPSGIKSEAVMYETNAKDIHESIIRKLNEIQENLEPTFELFELDPAAVVESVEEGFKKSARSLAVMPELSKESREVLAEEYSENMKLYVKKFTEDQIHILREITQDNAVAGYRFDRLASKIEDQYKVSATKAEFLARQETSLFMANFRKQRFGESGVTRYIWRTSRDQRVRDAHKHLEGKIFFYSQPPIVDRATGRTGNPGQDYGCRCVDEPVLDPVAVGT